MSRFMPVRWWPAAAAIGAVAFPLLAAEYVRFRRGRRRADAMNRERRESARPLDLDPVKHLEVRVVVEWLAEPGFRGEPGVSYLIRTEQGSLLYDMGFGSSTPVFDHNFGRLGIDPQDVSALAISHLHLDHMGGLRAQRTRRISLPAGCGALRDRTCFLPEEADSSEVVPRVVSSPSHLAAGLATPGPLARQLFFMGCAQELTLVARLHGRGLVVFTGCGHPGLGTILGQVERVFEGRVHAVVGGLHLPLTSGRGARGIPVQRIIGTGLPPWRVLDDADLEDVANALRAQGVERLLVSAHDSCDRAIDLLAARSGAVTHVLRAGRTYSL